MKLFAFAGLLVAAHAKCLRNITMPWRLPSSVKPNSYNLTFAFPDPNDDTAYRGSVAIVLDILQPTSCIIVHAGASVSISSAGIQLPGSSFLPPTRTIRDVNSSMVELHFPGDDLPSVTGVVLRIAYSGVASTQLQTGLYRSSNSYSPVTRSRDEVRDIMSNWNHMHKDPKDLQESKEITKEDRGEEPKEYMFATQFEDSFARDAFPCFDEPQLKSLFRASVESPSNRNLTVLFNTPEVSRSSSAGITTWVFKQTKHIMSPYLVAVSVGRHDYVEALTMSAPHIPLRIYTPVGASDYAKFALDVTVRVLDYYSKLWNFPIQSLLEKMDQISVGSFGLNAEENWGLLTYGPEFILTPSNERYVQEMVALVVTHEICHQWFGDTITLPWWTGEYINEGFARFYQYIATTVLFPEWDVVNEKSIFLPGGFDQSFWGFTYNVAMSADYLGSAPAVYLPDIENGKESSTIFYEKGASVNRMFYLTCDKWDAGLGYYLQKYKFGNPTATDLVSALTDSGACPGLKSQMLPWLTQKGFPIVTLSIALNGKSSSITASQKPVASTLPQSSLWFIPLHLSATPVDADGTRLDPVLLNLSFSGQSSQAHSLPPLPIGQHWAIEGNYNYTGFFLVDYAQKEQWSYLLDPVLGLSFSPAKRQQLAQQVYFLEKAKPASPSSALRQALASASSSVKESLQAEQLLPSFVV